ncbi:hypothetical protein BCR44DRAFT_41759 [Catenaria anguillulae PL171]|uniref:Secreted protein n=1 Tax=Catenaria anguillulae PL171 TaxID=765915 RepID=A0A1Y2HGP4_9FUNG|nr:hypothetical protein BCR44DRAFT_41759 [Catenaria anguillulae PL171]
MAWVVVLWTLPVPCGLALSSSIGPAQWQRGIWHRYTGLPVFLETGIKQNVNFVVLRVKMTEFGVLHIGQL